MVKKILAIEHPELLDEWDYNKNSSICAPEEITVGSHKKVWWKCENGHSWQAEIKARVSGNGCPFCSNKKIEQGFNDFASQNPELLYEWDYEKNTIDPKSIGSGSHIKVWWKCKDCGHEWQATISSRTIGRGCPVCAYKKRAISKTNADYRDSIAALYPELLEEWDYEQNGVLSPETVYPGSSKKVWWKCKKCHQRYYSSVNNRINGSGCPLCAGKTIIPGINDLQKWCKDNNRTDILTEWDYNKNTITPDQIAPFSGRKIYFICKEGHSYSSALSNRLTYRLGCPICNKYNRSSFQEQAILYYLRYKFKDAVNSYHVDWIGKQELDIYIPSIKTAIEYDGIQWHKNKAEQEQRKDGLCKENGIRLIRVREDGLDYYGSAECVSVDPRKKGSLNTAISTVIKKLCGDGTIIDIDVDRDTAEIVAQFDTIKRENSISMVYPDLLDEWDYERNGSVKPDSVSYGSTRKYWWKCKDCGHEFLMAPNNRTNQGQGCPICSGKKASASITKRAVDNRGSFQDSNSPLLVEWDYEKNTITPSEVTRSSKKKVWWKCETCGGRWLASVQNRTLAGNKCPYCTGRSVLVGFNDLATLHPELVDEWDCEKNGGLRPEEFTCGSNKKVLWTCSKCGNEWIASINDRTNGHGCPVCSRAKLGVTNQKKVLCVETNTVFNSVTKAASWANISPGSLVGHLKGKSKSSGGYHWKYVNPAKNDNE